MSVRKVGDLHDLGQRPSARLDLGLGLGLEGAERRPRVRRKVPPVGGATGVVVGHLAGDEQDRLRPVTFVTCAYEGGSYSLGAA